MERFLEEFCFQLTKNEADSLRSQFATSSQTDNKNHRGKNIF
ncbi:MAG: ORF6N domain-containing protein [Ruminococcus sp.]|nr:ORF6N domain-containing protein [Ruminococcus sp.]